jgi:hypothetical protein
VIGPLLATALMGISGDDYRFVFPVPSAPPAKHACPGQWRWWLLLPFVRLPSRSGREAQPHAPTAWRLSCGSIDPTYR